MKNTYRNKPDAQLVVFAQQFYNIVNGAAATYSVTPGDLLIIQAALSAFDASVTDQTAKEALFRATVETKRTARENILNTISSYANRFYANPAIDDTEIAATGLEPRDTQRTPVTPTTPQSLIAEPDVDGTVVLRWARNGNPYGVTFVVEEQPAGQTTWSPVMVTPRARVVLNGYEPGDTVTFRVFAQKGELQSPPSNVAVIYGEGGLADLTIAA